VHPLYLVRRQDCGRSALGRRAVTTTTSMFIASVTVTPPGHAARLGILTHWQGGTIDDSVGP
jgi:hypothetical protein